MPSRKSTPEGAIVKAILDYLAARRVMAFRMNTGAMKAEYNGKPRFMRFGMPGMADIVAFRSRSRGVDDKGNWCEFQEIIPLWIEVKAPTGKQSEIQKSFQQQVEAEGHRYVVARSIADVEAVL